VCLYSCQVDKFVTQSWCHHTLLRRCALPQPSDSDWDKPKPRHPIVGPASYPKSQPDVISAPGLFRKMDPEALFFAFYYQPDTYQQYLAAQVGPG
jgi:CCR4-NOT transcription complex subunit 3